MRAAFLDLDGTLCDGPSSAFLLRELVGVPGVNREYLRAALAAAERKEAKGPSPLRGGVYANYPPAMKGVHIREVWAAAKRAWPAMAQTMLPHTQSLVDMFRERGYLVILVTGGPREMARQVHSVYRMSMVVAADLARDNSGICTGELAAAPAKEGEKDRILRDMVRGFKLDMAGSFAMGNGIRDAEMMRLVGRSVAFEPEYDLEPVAQEQGWSIANRDNVLDVCGAVLNA